MYLGVLEPISNREDWTETIQTLDENNAVVDITGATITFALRDKKTKVQVLSADTQDGITISNPTQGIFYWSFTVDDVHSVCPGTYDVGLVIEISGTSSQLFIGTVQVLDGVVS